MLPLEHSAILLTFIKLPFVIKIFVLSIFEWLFYTGFTVLSIADPESKLSWLVFNSNRVLAIPSAMGFKRVGACNLSLSTETNWNFEKVYLHE